MVSHLSLPRLCYINLFSCYFSYKSFNMSAQSRGKDPRVTGLAVNAAAVLNPALWSTHSLSGWTASPSKALLQNLISPAPSSCFQMLPFSSCSSSRRPCMQQVHLTPLCGRHRIILLTFIIRFLGKTMFHTQTNSSPCLLSRMESWRLSHLIRFYFA